MFNFFPFPAEQVCKVCGWTSHVDYLNGTTVFDGTKEIFDGFECKSISACIQRYKLTLSMMTDEELTAHLAKKYDNEEEPIVKEIPNYDTSGIYNEADAYDAADNAKSNPGYGGRV